MKLRCRQRIEIPGSCIEKIVYFQVVITTVGLCSVGRVVVSDSRLIVTGSIDRHALEAGFKAYGTASLDADRTKLAVLEGQTARTREGATATFDKGGRLSFAWKYS